MSELILKLVLEVEQIINVAIGDNLENQDYILDTICLAQKGDEIAFGEIYNEYISPIYRYVSFKVTEEDIGDLVSDIFIKVWEKLCSFNGKSRDNFKSWIFTIAHNAIVDYYRTRKLTYDLDEAIDIESSDNSQNPEKLTIDNFLHDYFVKILKELPLNYKEIITLKYFNDFSNKEIADILRISETNVRVLLHRALQKIKQGIENEEQEVG